MKITNQQLKQIIKEELENVLEEYYSLPQSYDKISNQAFYDRRDKIRDARGPQTYKGLAGSHVDSIKQDPDIPPEHKEKLIKLFQSGPEGRKQAQQIMDTMGYGVETTFDTEEGPFEKIRNPFSGDDHPDTHHPEMRGYGYNKYKKSPFFMRGGGTFTFDEKDPNQYGNIDKLMKHYEKKKWN